MSPPNPQPRVIVVGAGTAGATLAWKLAAAEVPVLLVDRAQREWLGKPWINGVEDRLFADVGLPPPAAPLRYGARARIILESPLGARLQIHNAAVCDVHMRHLNEALVKNAVLAGARIRFSCSVRRVIVAGGFVQGVVLREKGQAEEEVRASCVVHAAGHQPLAGSEALGELAPGEPVGPEDICVASQEVRRIHDPALATEFMEAQGLHDHEHLTRFALCGGYSVATISIDRQREQVAFLTGAMLSQGQDAARRLLEELRESVGFAGERLFGGAGLIPVRRPHDRLVGPGYALLGDAGCQVYPAHGSGVAAGMRAALILANTLIGALRSNEPLDTDALWPYAAIFMRSRGALLAAAEITRRLAETYTAEDADRLVRSGLLREDMSRAVIACFPVRAKLRHLPGMLAAALGAGTVGRRLLRAARCASAQERHYRRFPARYDPRELAPWCVRARALARVEISPSASYLPHHERHRERDIAG